MYNFTKFYVISYAFFESYNVLYKYIYIIFSRCFNLNYL